MMGAEAADIMLSTAVSIADYREMVVREDRMGIAGFIRQRFTERYLTSLSTDPATKNGFAIMAISCLMIEALESFYQGSKRTLVNGDRAFASFFNRDPEFEPLRPLAREFYGHIRNGLLHQAETTGGWKIRRNGALFTPPTKTINAVRFVNAVQRVLSAYCSDLEREAWNAHIWQALRKKMDAICRNAAPKHE